MAGTAKVLVSKEGLLPVTATDLVLPLSFYYYTKPSQCSTKIKLRFVPHLISR